MTQQVTTRPTTAAELDDRREGDLPEVPKADGHTMKTAAMIVTLRLSAIALPALAMWQRFGPEERVDMASAEHLVALLLAAVFAFATGIVSTKLEAAPNE